MIPKKAELVFLSCDAGHVTIIDGQIFCEKAASAKEMRRILLKEIDFHKEWSASCKRKINQLEAVMSKLEITDVSDFSK